MKFEHILLVQQPERDGRISCVFEASTTANVIESLKQGLRLLALRPQAFGMELDDFDLDISVRNEQPIYTRRLVRGNFVMEDEVSLGANQECYQQRVLTPENMRNSLRTLRIEQPAPDVVILRCIYLSTTAVDHGVLSANEQKIVQQAYVAADKDFLDYLGRLLAHDALESLISLHAPQG
jgi:hypothetical protein